MDKYIHDLFNEEILQEAAHLYGVTLNELIKVGGFENYIYGYHQNGIDYIMRISHSSHRRLEEVESELDFVNYLAINNANVSSPIYSVNHRLAEKVECQDSSYFTISVYYKAKGERPRKEFITPKFFENYGKTIGRFHHITKNYQRNQNIKPRFTWNDDPLIQNASSYLPKADKLIYEKFQDLIKTILTIPKTVDNFGLIHTDIHMGNFFVLNDELTVFDFDDTSYMYFVSDIAIALFYYIQGIHDDHLRHDKAHEFMKLFMKGYLQENKLSEEDYSQITYFLKLREFVLYIVLHRSCDLETDQYANNYINFYRERLLNDIPFLNLNFSEYLK